MFMTTTQKKIQPNLKNNFDKKIPQTGAKPPMPKVQPLRQDSKKE